GAMKPSRMLKMEHHEIGRALKIIKSQAEKIEADREIDPSIISGTIFFLKEFGDRCHHSKEERVIFPVVERAGGDIGNSLVKVLVTDHKIGRELLAAISEINEAYGRGERDLDKNLAKEMFEYVTHMVSHIRAENTTLSDLMDQVFSYDEGEALYQQCGTIEEEIPESHQELVTTLERIEDDLAA
ncbi:MAG: hemerythrin domain-containing protein, partial [Chloroflexi bacterium]|nr:hemerythrin domain-containing protein [Chloroflexota bacterium]